MPGLTKVVQRRCEQRECDRFLIPVESGEVCQAPGCGKPLAIKRKLQTWVPAAGVSVLLLGALFAGLLLSKGGEVAASAAPAVTVEPAHSKPPPPGGDLSSATWEAKESMSRGQVMASRGRYEDARAEFQRATATDPASPAAWANLGAADAVTGRIEEARGAYEKALALAPDHWLAHYNLAVLLAREGDRDAAVHHLERFFSLGGTREETRRQALADLRRDPSLQGLLSDPRLRDFVGQ